MKVSILFGKTLLYIITILLFHRIHLVIVPDIINDRDNIHNYQNQKNNYTEHGELYHRISYGRTEYASGIEDYRQDPEFSRSKFGVSQLEFFLQMRVYAHVESKHHIYDKYEVNRHTS